MPVKGTAVDNYATYRRAVTADPFSCRVNNNVGAVLEWPAEVASATECVVTLD